MRHVVLSADGSRKVYSVPEEVADHLEKYCMKFRKWLKMGPYKHTKKYRRGGGFCYNEADFIEYLNRCVCSEERCAFVKDLGWIAPDAPLPEPYQDCPEFNF